ncbi:MAG: hypothetical protein PUP92_27720 [Rhizonema sp. PD38]|nr:hypothetical protein [Rhizonema sp. PD38]
MTFLEFNHKHDLKLVYFFYVATKKILLLHDTGSTVSHFADEYDYVLVKVELNFNAIIKGLDYEIFAWAKKTSVIG